MDTKNNDSLIKDLGLNDLPEKDRNEMVANLAEALQNRITTRVMDTLSDEEKKELDKIVEAGDDKKVGEYLKDRIPGLSFIEQDEYERFRAEVLNKNEDIKTAVKENLAKS